MGQTDIQFKNDLRKDLIFLEELLELLDNNETEKMRKKIQANIDRINASLQD